MEGEDNGHSASPRSEEAGQTGGGDGEMKEKVPAVLKKSLTFSADHTASL